jgi:hypothetical protein
VNLADARRVPSPCGMIVDALRSCYTVGMRFSDTLPIIPVRWFFADKRAKFFPGPNAFYSRNWEDKSDRFDQLGEQPGPRPWANGIRPGLALGQRLCDPPLIFLVGLAPGFSFNRPVASDSTSLCCLDPMKLPLGCAGSESNGATEWVSCGGAVGAGQSVVSKTPHYFSSGGALGSGQSGWVVF